MDRATGDHAIQPEDALPSGDEATHCAKRRKVSRYIYLQGFDEPKKLVKCDSSIVNAANCQLGKRIVHEEPDFISDDGLPVWFVSATRSILICFVKSMTSNTLYPPSDTTWEEVVQFFNYQGMSVSGAIANRVPCGNDAPRIDTLIPCLANHDSKSVSHACSVHISTEQACNSILHALLFWPRLHQGLVSTGMSHTADVEFTCTPSLAWVAFVDPISWPPVAPRMTAHDEIFAAVKSAKFLPRMLMGIGHVEYVMKKQNLLYLCAEGQYVVPRASNFQALYKRCMEIEDTRWFLSCRGDIPSTTRYKGSDLYAHMRSFVKRCMKDVQDAGQCDNEASVTALTPNVRHARSCVKLALNILRAMPNCAMLFGSACADERQSTPERKLLESCLKSGKIKCVRWASTEDNGVTDGVSHDGECIRPLVFQAGFEQRLLPEASGRRPYPMVLLDFSQCL